MPYKLSASMHLTLTVYEVAMCKCCTKGSYCFLFSSIVGCDVICVNGRKEMCVKTWRCLWKANLTT